MLKPRVFYDTEVNKLLLEAFYDPRNSYFFVDGYTDYQFSTQNSTWNEYSFASVTERADGTYVINGIFHANISRSPRFVSSLYLMRFNDSIVFEKDLINFFDLLLLQSRFEKVSFTVAVGNPAEHFYDKFINKYGGRIVGTRIRHGQIPDGRIVDLKMYEIFEEEYRKNRGRSFNA